MKWKILKTEACFQGYFRVDRHQIAHQRFDGGEQVVTREVFERGHAVAVLPYDVVRDEVLLVEQFRAGAMAAGEYPWLMELIAGIIEEGESKEAVAIREAKEEADCTLERLLPIYDYLVSPGGSSETISLYCAPTEESFSSGVYGLDEEGEDIRAHVLKRESAMDMLATGKVSNAMTIIALQWLQLNYSRIK